MDLAGHRDVLGMWAGEGDGESAKYWLSVLTDLKNRGVADIFFLVCDGLKGLPQSVGAAFPDTVAQTCVIHLIRGTFGYAGRQHRDAIAKAIKPIYNAFNAEAAAAALDAFDAEWGQRYPAAIRLWRNASSEFIPFLDYDTEIRKVICSTNVIESLNARYPRAIRARGHSERAGSHEMPILGHPVTGPDRDRPEAMDHALETSIERLRDHLRRPHAGQRNHLTEDAAYTVNRTVPRTVDAGVS